jgi:GH24 family phage-related lysozyme (muramidase)
MQLHFFDPSETTTRVQDLLARVEGFRPGVYWDSARTPRATIGFGFNLEAAENDYLRLVLEEIYGSSGINVDGFLADFRKGIAKLRPTQAQVRQDPALYNAQLRAALDGLVHQNLLPGQTFEPFQLTKTEATTVERQILEGYTIDGVFTDGKLLRLQQLLSDVNGISLPSNSNEFVALASLFYNREDLIGSNLLAALKAGGRAEAWYEIRYQSNGGQSRSPGIANRRYRESDQFGLYDPGPITDSIAKNVMATYTLHGDVIRNYEGTFSAAAPNAQSTSVVSQ